VVLQPLWALAVFPVFLIYAQSLELLGRGISPSQGHYLHREQHKHRIMHTDIYASSGIRSHDVNARASEDFSCLRPRSHCYLLIKHHTMKNYEEVEV
jgi:hypothetical protein